MNATNRYANAGPKPAPSGALALIDGVMPWCSASAHSDLRKARATVERMAEALQNANDAIARMVCGEQVNVTATMRANQAALAAFRGEA